MDGGTATTGAATAGEGPDEQDFTAWDTRLAAYAVILEPDRGLLLSLQNDLGEPIWGLPGGGVDLFETPEEGCVREVREETGYAVRLGPLLGVGTATVAPEQRVERVGERWFRAVRVFFDAEVVGGALTAEVGGTTDEARWWPLPEVSALPCHPMVADALALHAAAAGSEVSGSAPGA